jgi:hypothetical protein
VQLLHFASTRIKNIELFMSMSRRWTVGRTSQAAARTPTRLRKLLELIAARVASRRSGPGKPWKPMTSQVSPAMIFGPASQVSVAAAQSPTLCGHPEIDYGIIVRAVNPFNPAAEILVIAGAYGYGTWGGAELISNESFLDRCNSCPKVSELWVPVSGFSGSDYGLAAC